MQRKQMMASAVLVLAASVACAKKEPAVDTTTALPSAPPPAPAAPALTDPNIVYILDQANAADSARGKVAETKATSAEVKRFGRLMMGEHHGLRVAGQALAKKLGVTPQAPANDQSEAQTKQETDTLQAVAKGKAWDKRYIDFEVTYHQAVLETATAALGAAQNAELKKLIQTAAPVIQRHLDMAKQIQSKM
jgi:putative membrane protein